MSRPQAAFDAAIRNIRTTLQSVQDRVCDSLSAASQSNSVRPAERDVCQAAFIALRRQAAGFHRTFAQILQEKIRDELIPRGEAGKRTATGNWQTLSLVGDAEIEERMFADRIGQTIAHACDAEMRELAPYIGSLLASAGRPAADRNPLRAEMLGAPLSRAIESVCQEPAERQLLAREFAQAMAKAMPGCYAAILEDLQARGIRPAVLTTRGVEGPGMGGGNSGYSTLDGVTGGRSEQGEADPSTALSQDESGHHGVPAYRQTERHGGSRLGSTGSGLSTTAGLPQSRSGHGVGSGQGGSDAGRGGHDGGQGIHGGGSGGHGETVADAQLMALLRRLNAVVGHPGDTGADAFRARTGGTTVGGRLPTAAPTGATAHAHSPQAGQVSAAGEFDPLDSRRRGMDPVGELMAVNLIRAHREELLQASPGQLDHMVIDVVGSLFDQILSDARVPPQMARQIARLQLPVLRVALSDRSFFSSRRHPVRRFVNRIASLACAFDDFAAGPGLDFLERVRGLVQEIVDGDFDQIELYTAKLADLERFITDQAGDQVERNGTRATLEHKETELRLQQRYMLQLQAALGPLTLPAYLSDFLAQVWSQALVLAGSREGANSDRSQRFRRAGRDLVMSVQPKGSLAMRQKFLMQLPPLMKDLADGLRLVGWPEEAQRHFYAQLRPAQAASLKARAMSELDHNLMVKQLDAILNQPLPNAAGAGSPIEGPVPAAGNAPALPLEDRFTPEEARRVGLVDDSAIDWSGAVDIDLGGETEPEPLATMPGVETGPQVDLYLDLMLAATPAGPVADVGAAESAVRAAESVSESLSDPASEPASEPARGPQLMAHIQVGFAYQMHLKEGWRKVRLTHVSPGRNFFVFSRGHRHQETLSMTARMLSRMCDTGRLRAVESAYLMERATQRARKQLAALRTPVTP